MHHSLQGLEAFDIAAILVVPTAVLGYLNHHFLRLPQVIGLTVMGALTAILLMLTDAFFPGVSFHGRVSEGIEQIDFSETLLQGMLSFLL